jgi:hypothetical protein
MSKAKHTPEPWEFSMDMAGNLPAILIPQGAGKGYVAQFNHWEDAKRAAACVNGCAGIDPAAVSALNQLQLRTEYRVLNHRRDLHRSTGLACHALNGWQRNRLAELHRWARGQHITY